MAPTNAIKLAGTPAKTFGDYLRELEELNKTREARRRRGLREQRVPVERIRQGGKDAQPH
jgi:hypothetical protein